MKFEIRIFFMREHREWRSFRSSLVISLGEKMKTDMKKWTRCWRRVVVIRVLKLFFCGLNISALWHCSLRAWQLIIWILCYFVRKHNLFVNYILVNPLLSVHQKSRQKLWKIDGDVRKIIPKQILITNTAVHHFSFIDHYSKNIQKSNLWRRFGS